MQRQCVFRFDFVSLFSPNLPLRKGANHLSPQPEHEASSPSSRSVAPHRRHRVPRDRGDAASCRHVVSPGGVGRRHRVLVASVVVVLVGPPPPSDDAVVLHGLLRSRPTPSSVKYVHPSRGWHNIRREEETEAASLGRRRRRRRWR